MEVDPNPLKRCSSAPQINTDGLPNSPVARVCAQTCNISSRRETLTPTPPVKMYTSNNSSPRARRFSASFSPHGAGGSPSSKLVPRISQIRQEECPDLANAREASHEREMLSDMQMSQSCDDLTLITESWSFKGTNESEPITNVLHLNFGGGNNSCASPTRLRLPYHGMSPSPTRQKTFATRRSMSPIPMRPSQLAGSVKRKFELDDSSNTCSPPPNKKLYIDRNPSPSFLAHRQSPSPLCLSPDSSSFDGRITPKHFISKLTTNPPPSSVTSSPVTEVSDTPSEMEIESSSSTQEKEDNEAVEDKTSNKDKIMRVDENLVTTTNANL